jgi:DNA mismatch repair protein MutH
VPIQFRDNLPYDPADKESIIEYAGELVGHTLREKTDAENIADPKKRRGAFGDTIEYAYFGIEPNSVQGPDFPEAGLELKTTPAKRAKSGKLAAKERLVITMIDYMTVVGEKFETSTLLEKSSDVLLITYLYDKEKDPLDYIIEVAMEWGLPEEDMPVFKEDWETVVNKVRAGKAHEISGSDTLYLEACTKASNSRVRRPQPFSDIPAKPRAWALKASYMTATYEKMGMQAIKRSSGERTLGLLDLVKKRFSPYFGMTETELGERFGYIQQGKRKPKNLCALITRRILGVEEDAKIAEFEKAGIKPKTIRLQINGRPKEAVSFRKFDYRDLALRDFEDSDFLGYLEQKYLFVIYRESETKRGVYRLSDVCFWQMPDDDLPEAKRCYDQMRENVRTGHADVSVKSSENRCCHVRPHGRNTRDTCPTPYGTQEVKKCFWLNQGYLQEEIARVLKAEK